MGKQAIIAIATAQAIIAAMTEQAIIASEAGQSRIAVAAKQVVLPVGADLNLIRRFDIDRERERRRRGPGLVRYCQVKIEGTSRATVIMAELN